MGEMISDSVNCEYPPPKYDGHVLEPVQVQVFFRHGDRSPIAIRNARMDVNLWASRAQEYPSELSEKEYEYQEFPWGQLTKKGKDQALGLGQWLRKNYMDVLQVCGDVHSSIHYRCTNYQRTHLTGWYVLNGLLGSSEAAASVPVHIRARKDETLVVTGDYPKLTGILKDHMNAAVKPVEKPDGTFEPSEIDVVFEKLKVGVTSFLALNPNTVFSWHLMDLILDALYCGTKHGDPLPDSLLEEDVLASRNALRKYMMIAFSDKTFLRFGMGRLMREILEAIGQFQSRGSANSAEGFPSLCLYSGHDNTIMPLLVALGAKVESWPDYCSNIIIELLKSADLPGKYFIRVLYNGVEQPLFTGPDEPKIVLTLDEFLQHAGRTSVSEEEFRSFCRDSIVN